VLPVGCCTEAKSGYPGMLERRYIPPGWVGRSIPLCAEYTLLLPGYTPASILYPGPAHPAAHGVQGVSDGALGSTVRIAVGGRKEGGLGAERCEGCWELCTDSPRMFGR